MAERTGLEPATPGVTGRYSNQLNYRSVAVLGARLKGHRRPTFGSPRRALGPNPNCNGFRPPLRARARASRSSIADSSTASTRRSTVLAPAEICASAPVAAALRAGSSTIPAHSSPVEHPRAQGRHVLTDPAAEQDRIRPAEHREVGAEVLAHPVAVQIEGQPGRVGTGAEQHLHVSRSRQRPRAVRRHGSGAARGPVPTSRAGAAGTAAVPDPHRRSACP